MGVVPLDWDEVQAAVERSTDRVAELLRAAPQLDTRVPGLDWTVGDVAAHLVTVAHRYEGFARGVGTAPDESLVGEARRRFIQSVNEEELRSVGNRDPAGLADRLVEGSQAFLSAVPSGGAPMKIFDIPTDAASASGVWLGELLVHGLDIARALRRSWKIARPDALITAYGVLSVLPWFVDTASAAGFRGTYEVRLRGGQTISIAFDDGKAQVSRGRAARPDCRISADPVAFLLVGYRRRSRWTAGLLGRTIAYGRKPWLAFRFNDLLVEP